MMKKKKMFKCPKCDETVVLFIEPSENPTHHHQLSRKTYVMKEII